MDVYKKLRKPKGSIESEASEFANLISLVCKKITVDQNPESSFNVSVEIGEQSILFVIDPPPQSMGRILGSGGKTINALRVIAKAMCAPHGFRGVIEVVYREKDQVPLSKV
ncbi:hypothetical protein AZI86_01215 [Bdellovibrio bacteriovorus]|uniref:RNA-binding protein n=1 Tax=Bdellovibrio bacteriovorus TaxID=959 RepID=A0A150WMX6_BDEBC|nr:KH domain-containing protein [Bdellovibrio bacteriovorus]KYG65724.1 hypothetical protein AZI86_01215 [Bdellovibrio bacteriovorus]